MRQSGLISYAVRKRCPEVRSTDRRQGTNGLNLTLARCERGAKLALFPASLVTRGLVLKTLLLTHATHEWRVLGQHPRYGARLWRGQWDVGGLAPSSPAFAC